MLGTPWNMWRKPSACAICSNFEPGSVMAMKWVPALSAATHRLLDPFEEILFEDVRLERRAGLTGDDENRIANVNFVLESFHLSGIGGIQHKQFRVAVNLPESHLENFRTQAGPTHAEQEGMLETCCLHIGRDIREMLLVGELILGDAEPSQPLSFVRSSPQGCIASPQAAHLACHFPILDSVLKLRVQLGRQGISL